MEDFEIYALCIRIICSIIILICLVSFILLCREKDTKSLSNMIKFQLTITCFLHSLFYIFPPVRPFFCEFQSMLNTFGELSKLAIATMIMLLAQLTFTNSHELEHKKKFYFFISVSISWVLPILIGVLAIITGDTNKYSDFCWIQNKIFLFIFIAIRFLIVIAFFASRVNCYQM